MEACVKVNLLIYLLIFRKSFLLTANVNYHHYHFKIGPIIEFDGFVKKGRLELNYLKCIILSNSLGDIEDVFPISLTVF